MQRADPAAVDTHLSYLFDHGGSDLLLTAGAPPWVRIDGQLLQIGGAKPLRPADVEQIVDAMLTPEQAASFAVHKQIDFSFNWRSQARFRANAFRQRGSVGIAIRMIPFSIPSFDELGIPPIVEQFVNQQQGLILVTGPTGSGKSTTLAAMIDWINHNRACHVLTIEDPIEYVHRHALAAVNQREVGEDTSSFQAALRAALREDPDVLLVGEMRDLESIQITLTVAETGHLVLATLHTNDTSQAIDRIVDVFPAERQDQIRVQLSNSLTAVMHQRLLPRIDGGRAAAFEVLIANTAVKNLIKDGKTRQIRNVIGTSQREGMCTIEESLSVLVADGIVEHDVAVRASVHPKEVRSRLGTVSGVGAMLRHGDQDDDDSALGRRGRRRR